jgi:hypothetical protein
VYLSKRLPINPARAGPQPPNSSGARSQPRFGPYLEWFFTAFHLWAIVSHRLKPILWVQVDERCI